MGTLEEKKKGKFSFTLIFIYLFFSLFILQVSLLKNGGREAPNIHFEVGWSNITKIPYVVCTALWYYLFEN